MLSIVSMEFSGLGSFRRSPCGMHVSVLQYDISRGVVGACL